jgi:hypothetical protein
MGGHLLGDLEPATILEVGGDAGSTEGVAADLGLDPGSERPPVSSSTEIWFIRAFGEGCVSVCGRVAKVEFRPC